MVTIFGYRGHRGSRASAYNLNIIIEYLYGFLKTCLIHFLSSLVSGWYVKWIHYYPRRGDCPVTVELITYKTTRIIWYLFKDRNLK